MSAPFTQKPDLNDNTNVVKDAYAAQRENHMLTEGAEPISLWVMIGALPIIVLIAGSVIGSSLFDYNNVVKKGYVRKGDGSGGAASKPVPAMAAYQKIGEKIVKSVCLGCHGRPDGKGTNDTTPLSGSEWVNGPSLRPAMIILNGCQGPISVAGKTYSNKMPPQGAGLGPKELAGILNYVRNNFGNKNEKLITMEMAQDALDTSKARNGGQMSAEELNAKFKRELKGTELDPNTLVDPKTLKPVPAPPAKKK